MFAYMKLKHLKPGMTVHVKSSTDEFDYVLMKQDVIDIKTGEWDEVGLKIDYEPSKLTQVLDCLKYGILPWRCYEDVKHYDCTYWQHMRINLCEAWRIITG